MSANLALPQHNRAPQSGKNRVAHARLIHYPELGEDADDTPDDEDVQSAELPAVDLVVPDTNLLTEAGWDRVDEEINKIDGGWTKVEKEVAEGTASRKILVCEWLLSMPTEMLTLCSSFRFRPLLAPM